MAVINTRSASKYCRKELNLTANSKAHEQVHSGGDREEVFLQGLELAGHHLFVATLLKICACSVGFASATHYYWQNRL